MIFLRLFLISLFVFVPLFHISGQQKAVSEDDITGIISFVAIPETPGADERVNVTLEASGINLNTALITWSLNGQRIRSGRGEIKVDFLMGPLGTQNVIGAIIESAGQTYRYSQVFRSGDIDIIWQGETYTPPFYKGRSLWSGQSKLTIVAIPHIINSSGVPINPSALVYRWAKNNIILGNISGLGKSSFSFTDSILSLPQKIEVKVFDTNNLLLASKSINLSPGRPKLLAYENSPLLGYLFNKEVGGNFAFNKREITLSAFPYFMSVVEKNSDTLQFSWNTNSSSNITGSEVIYSIPEDQSGSSRINISVNNLDKLLQSGSKDFLVQFSDNSL